MEQTPKEALRAFVNAKMNHYFANACKATLGTFISSCVVTTVLGYHALGGLGAILLGLALGLFQNHWFLGSNQLWAVLTLNKKEFAQDQNRQIDELDQDEARATLNQING